MKKTLIGLTALTLAVIFMLGTVGCGAQPTKTTEYLQRNVLPMFDAATLHLPICIYVDF